MCSVGQKHYDRQMDQQVDFGAGAGRTGTDECTVRLDTNPVEEGQRRRQIAGVSPFFAAATVNNSRPAGDVECSAPVPYFAAFVDAEVVPHSASWCPELSATTVANTRPWSESSGCPVPRYACQGP